MTNYFGHALRFLRFLVLLSSLYHTAPLFVNYSIRNHVFTAGGGDVAAVESVVDGIIGEFVTSGELECDASGGAVSPAIFSLAAVVDNG